MEVMKTGSAAVLTSSSRVHMLTDMHEDGWLMEDLTHHISSIIMEMLDDLDIYGPEDDPLDGSCSSIVDSDSVEYLEGVKLFDAKYYGMDETTPFAENHLSEDDDFDKTALHHYEEFKLFDATRHDRCW